MSRINRKIVVAVTICYFVEISLWGLFPFHTSKLDDGLIYRNLHKEGALLELPLGVVRPSHYHQIYHSRPISGGMGESLKILWSEDYERIFLKRFGYFRKFTRILEPPELDSDLVSDFVYLTVDKRIVMSIFDKAGAVKGRQYLINLCLLFGQPIEYDKNIAVWDLTASARIDVCEEQKWMETAKMEPSSWELLMRERGRIP